VVHRSALFAFALFELGHGAAAKHFVLQESFDRRLRARSTAFEFSAFGLCDRPRDDGFSVARFGGLGRLSCEDGYCLPVHGIPHKSLGDSKRPGTAECNRREVLRVDGGLDFFGQGIPGLFVYQATCALFKGRYGESHTYALIPLILVVPTKKTGCRSGKRTYLELEV
jgi:hypothetical protein